MPARAYVFIDGDSGILYSAYIVAKMPECRRFQPLCALMRAVFRCGDLPRKNGVKRYALSMWTLYQWMQDLGLEPEACITDGQPKLHGTDCTRV